MVLRRDICGSRTGYRWFVHRIYPVREPPIDVINENLAVGMGTRTTRIKRTNADSFLLSD